MRRIRRLFAPPFVITIACGHTPDSTASLPAPAPTPAPAPHDAAVPLDTAPLDTADRPIEAAIVGVIRFNDPGCVRREVNGEDTSVDCPDDVLPMAGAGELVVSPYGTSCYRVYERKLGERVSRTVFDEGRVRCPPGGPNVRLPEKRTVNVGRESYQLDEESLTCSREIMGNPPSWRRSECPQALVPQLVGLEPDAPCSYRGIAVNCVRPGTGAGLSARIIAIQVVNEGTKITLAIGREDGAAPGMSVTVGKRIHGTLATCSKRTCTVIVLASPDQVKAAGSTAEVSN